VNVLSQRIAARDWQNVAKITGMTPSKAQAQFAHMLRVAKPVDPIEVLKVRAVEAAVKADEKLARWAEYTRKANIARRVKRVRAFVENKPWFDLIERRLWRAQWRMNDLAIALNMDVKKLRRAFCEQGDFPDSLRDRIMLVLDAADASAAVSTEFNRQTGRGVS
jgi:hypothetical protein